MPNYKAENESLKKIIDRQRAENQDLKQATMLEVADMVSKESTCITIMHDHKANIFPVKNGFDFSTDEKGNLLINIL